ncbi:MAG: SRPBCC domain-containing protein [Pseudonocardia sp.]
MTIADGLVETTPDGPRLRFERHLAHPVERVWAALTDPARLRDWWGDAELTASAGTPFRLTWRNTDEAGQAAQLVGTVTRAEPPHLLVLDALWGFSGSDEPGMPTTLVWELVPEGDGTLLRFTNDVGMPETCLFAVAGWHLHLDALDALLAGGSLDIVHPEPVWEPIHAAYVARYGS